MRRIVFAIVLIGMAGAARGAAQTFEVAMLRLEDPHSTVDYNRPDAPNQNQKYPSNRMIEFHIMLKSLISQAWAVPYQNILDGPSWIDSQHYDLSAKVEGEVRLTKEQMRPMLRNLLEQRLHLAVHSEHRIVSGYALVVAKGGSKMKPNEGAPFAGTSGTFGFKFQNAPVAQLTGLIEHELKKPVADKTGLVGMYDFELRFSHENAPIDALYPDYGSIFTALPDQLGLRLAPQKLPVEYLIIDHVERAPNEN
ncbi:MAG TPA: TIGR03435 family protein [Bryobacteraceae bacterium]|jgi:uncharacterized protein (TIGR03435 family)